MRYATYLKPGQKILLKTVTANEVPDRFEAFTVHLVHCGVDFLDLALPYELESGEGLPFHEQMTFRLITEAFGLGMQMTGHYLRQIDRHVFRIQPNDDMEAFARREYLRVDATLGVYCMRGRWSLRSARSRWGSAVKTIERDGGQSARPHIITTPINISAGGIRLTLPSVTLSELSLVLIDLADGLLPICALSEVTWLAPPDAAGLQTAGLRFVNILQADRERLDIFVLSELRRKGFDVAQARTARELLDSMHF